MKCEHAQDLFSEYVEHALDKPTTVALEAHLTACPTCQRGVEGLSQTWDALSAVPEIEPPKELAWRVLVQLQRERLERFEAERKRLSPVVRWFQSLTPGTAFGYALLVAILFVALAFPLRGPIAQVVPFGYDGGDRTAPVSVGSPGAPLPEAPVPTTGLLVAVGQAQRDPQTGQWFYRLVINAAANQPDGEALVNPLVVVNGQLYGTQEQRGLLVSGQPLLVAVPAMVGASRVQAVSVRVQTPGLGPLERIVYVPVNR